MKKYSRKKVNVARAKKRFARLPKKSQKRDKARSAKRNTSMAYVRHPNRYDYPNVDTRVKRKPKRNAKGQFVKKVHRKATKKK